MRNKTGGDGIRLFGRGDEQINGRTCMLMYSLINAVIVWLSGGMFYTRFLMNSGINIVNVGIISFVPLIANCFSIFSPSILERFPRRKWVLAGSRVLYYALHLLAITVLPVLVSDPGLRLALFVVLTFAANIVNALFVGGYTVWHLNFIQDQRVRAKYFSTTQMISSFVGQTAALLSSFLADALVGSPFEETIIVVFRYAAFALGLLEVYVLTRPVEYPYSRTASRPRFRDIFVMPLKCRPFALAMVMIFIYNVSINLPAGVLNYYLLDTVGVSYTFTYAINMIYPFIVLLLMRRAQGLVHRWGWFGTFGRMTLLLVPTYFLYAFIAPDNYLWLLPTVRIAQHFIGVAHNLAYANLAFVSIPPDDQTNYISFHTLAVNIGAFLGMMAGTWVVDLTEGFTVGILGRQLGGVQMLLGAEGFLELGLAVAILLLLKKLQPSAPGLRRAG